MPLSLYLFLAIAAFAGGPPGATPSLPHRVRAAGEWADDNAVRDFMIKDSIHHFIGGCPCPFHFRPDGSLCGVKSGYDQTNGRMPLCYRTDISLEMVAEFRAKLARGSSAVIK